jgi:hypothetical protein
VELTPLPFLAGDPDAAAVGLHEVFDDVQAQSRAAGLDAEGVEDAAKLGEQAVDLALGNADAVVGERGDELDAVV